jgi:hypothetical protein
MGSSVKGFRSLYFCHCIKTVYRFSFLTPAIRQNPVWYFICLYAYMKDILNVSFLFLLFVNLGWSQAGQTVTQIELSKISRGYQEDVRITPDSVHILMDDNTGQPRVRHSRKLEPQEWTRLVQSLDNVQLKSIPSLPSPTMNRAVDAARHSTLTVSTSDGRSYPHGFDDEEPHETLQPLLKVLREISGPVEKQ